MIHQSAVARPDAFLKIAPVLWPPVEDFAEETRQIWKLGVIYKLHTGGPVIAGPSAAQRLEAIFDMAGTSFAGTFHHIGLACQSIAEEAPALSLLGFNAESEIIEDPIQRVRVQFFAGAGPRVELVEPTGDDSPISRLLKRGTRFYHLAYEVTDLDAAMAALEQDQFRRVTEPAPATAFAMRRIVFLLSGTGTLIELVEARQTV